MGADVFALVTRWEPMVADFRAAGGLDFYWDVNAAYNDAFPAAEPVGRSVPERLLSYAVERPYQGGFSFVSAGWYYGFLRPLLPVDLRVPVSAFLDMVYGEDPPDDLREDSAVAADSAYLYAMRPATVRLAHARAQALPWDTFYEVAEGIVVPEMDNDRYTPDFGSASIAMYVQRDWIAEAAATDCGIVVIISQ
ncbi:hypothetical protein [Actinomadura verrucosospora]|uniref:Uncharacterized protein n=1 Tax=Actinomadura verrucosospora TaxID=46165 RepID=A0A7D3ZE54_ACTVE|nr:hypothetical protein [Actinomadura verrucosospora]QKG20837.1 hypothetical protein ACTIVE_2475 [Actinomadura verrucosospora]